MKNKSVYNCRSAHHTKFYCIMIMLKKLFGFEFERGETGKEPSLTEFFCNLSLGLEMNSAVHSLYKVSA